jgi:uronate dehydrogenase
LTEKPGFATPSEALMLDGLSAPAVVLVTGAGGCIGRQICPPLQAQGYTLRTFGPDAEGLAGEAFVGRLEDLDALRRAAAGADAILHLAAHSDEGDFVTELVPSNVVGLYHALEAARLQGVKRFVLASSCQAADLGDQGGRIGVDARHPSGLYGLTKLWAEEMGRLYARLHGIHVLAARLGWVPRDASEVARMAQRADWRLLFLSHDDVRAFFLRALQAPLPPFATVYAFSRQAEGEVFDMGPARRLLGYAPGDAFSAGLTFPPEG